MAHPWHLLDPTNRSDPWWIASRNLLRVKRDNSQNIECYFIIQDCNVSASYYRIFVWYKNDSERYFSVHDDDYDFDVKLSELTEGSVIKNHKDIYFRVLDCQFCKTESQKKYVKILERIES
jgi:hypothetical protein